MKVKAISLEHCGKCEQAKIKLKDYPIEWFVVEYSHEAGVLAEKYDVTKVPAFLIFENDKFVRKTTNVLEIKDMFKNAEKEN